LVRRNEVKTDEVKTDGMKTDKLTARQVLLFYIRLRSATPDTVPSSLCYAGHGPVFAEQVLKFNAQKKYQ
ncbi:MAG: hypothetical protein U9Q98_03010, partial [Bacteroidota bacterium]|nr:hypothetical protein [Bacteroidota bacterium]